MLHEFRPGEVDLVGGPNVDNNAASLRRLTSL